MRFYLASQYTVGDALANVHRQIHAAEVLQSRGHDPYVPLLNHYWQEIYPHGEDVWLRIDFAFLPVCDALVRLPGPSIGADKEVALAKRHRKLIFYGMTEFELWDDRRTASLR